MKKIKKKCGLVKKISIKYKYIIMSSNVNVKQKVISFAEIVQGRDATVRVTPDGLLYAVDLVVVITGQTRHQAAKTLRFIPENIFLGEKISLKKVENNKGKETKVISFPDAIELVMILPGRIAKETRTQFADIIRRYLAGDHSLIQEIQANAQSASPIAQMARDSLGIIPDADLKLKRRRENIELENLQALSVTRKQKNVTDFMEAMERLDPNWKQDTRLVVQTKDLLKNIVLGPQASITNGQDSQALPLSIQDLARELGYGTLGHGDLCKIGRKAIELYRAKHDCVPPKRLQFVDGAERMVNAYTEADRELLIKAVEAVLESC